MTENFEKLKNADIPRISQKKNGEVKEYLYIVFLLFLIGLGIILGPYTIYARYFRGTGAEVRQADVLERQAVAMERQADALEAIAATLKKDSEI